MTRAVQSRSPRAITRDEYEDLKRLLSTPAPPHPATPRAIAFDKRAVDILRKCKLLGNGSERVAYEVVVDGYAEPSVFKIQRRRVRPISQTSVETFIYRWFWHEWKDLIPRVYDWSPNLNNWIEVELLKTVTRRELKEEREHWPMGRRDSYCWSLPPRLAAFVTATRLQQVELDFIHHWGRSADGQIKLRDFGYR